MILYEGASIYTNSTASTAKTVADLGYSKINPNSPKASPYVHLVIIF